MYHVSALQKNPEKGKRHVHHLNLTVLVSGLSNLNAHNICSCILAIQEVMNAQHTFSKAGELLVLHPKSCYCDTYM